MKNSVSIVFGVSSAVWRMFSLVKYTRWPFSRCTPRCWTQRSLSCMGKTKNTPISSVASHTYHTHLDRIISSFLLIFCTSNTAKSLHLLTYLQMYLMDLTELQSLISALYVFERCGEYGTTYWLSISAWFVESTIRIVNVWPPFSSFLRRFNG